jgi:hypothetical protein
MVTKGHDESAVTDMFDDAESIKLGGFPPYWNPTEGETIYFEPLFKDARDPEFVRYVCRALMPLTAATGSKTEGKDEPVEVLAGERFCISEYTSLPLEQLLGNPAIPLKLVTLSKERVASDPKKTRWAFDLIVPKGNWKTIAKARVAAFIPAANVSEPVALPQPKVVAPRMKGLPEGGTEQGL